MKRLWLFLLSFSIVVSGVGVWAEQPQNLVAMVGNGSMFVEPDPEEYKVLKMQIMEGDLVYDPFYEDGFSQANVMNHLYEGLYRLINDEFVPGMAESYDLSSDGLIYTFHLRDAQWSDNQPVTANDFEYAWKRVVNPENQGEYAFKFFDIRNAKAYSEGTAKAEDVGIQALDAKTLQVTLEKPTPYFLKLVSSLTFTPVREDLVEQSPDEWSYDENIRAVNGPYQLKYDGSYRITLTKNPKYWNASNIKIDYLDMIVVQDPFAAYSYYKSNDLDLINLIPNNLINENPSVKKDTYIATAFSTINHKNVVLQDVRVRRALTLAIDRSFIAEKVTMYGDVPAYGIVPPGFKLGSGQDFNHIAGDYGISSSLEGLDEAQRLLSEAGYPDGEGFPVLKVISTESEEGMALSNTIARMWKENLNINVEFEYKDWNGFMTAMDQGQYDIASLSWHLDYEDPMTFLEMCQSNSDFNDSNWHDSTYDQILEDARYATGAQRDQLLIQAEKRLMDQSVLIPIDYMMLPYMMKEKVVNADLSQIGVWYFGNADVVE